MGWKIVFIELKATQVTKVTQALVTREDKCVNFLSSLKVKIKYLLIKNIPTFFLNIFPYSFALYFLQRWYLMNVIKFSFPMDMFTFTK